MRTWIRCSGLGCLVLTLLACGSKGDDTGTGGGAGTGAATGGGAGTATGGSTAGTGGAGTGGTLLVDSGGDGSGGPLKTYAFASDTEGWVVQFASSAPGVPLVDLAMTHLTHNATEGHPDPGSMQVEIPFTSGGQYLEVAIVLPTTAPPINLTGRLVTAYVRILSGVQDSVELATVPAGVSVYAKSVPGFVYAAGRTNLNHAMGDWTPVIFDPMNPTYEDMANPAGRFDPASVYELGLQLETGGMSTTATTGVVVIDTVSY